MCLAVIQWQPDAAVPLKGVANRDEFRARPTAALAHWHDLPILAGRDLEAGGSWLGFDRDGRFALLTNLRAGASAPGLRSRGELVVNYLSGGLEPMAFCEQLAERLEDYAGFNLLLGTREELVYTGTWHPGAHPLQPGLHVLSNAPLGARWPKCELALVQMQAEHPLLEKDLGQHAILACTRPAPEHALPDTGIPLAMEHRLSAQTILGEDYGTRSRTHWRLGASGVFDVLEQQLDQSGNVISARQLSTP